MKIIIKENIPYADVKKYLPKKYLGIFKPAAEFSPFVNLVIFPYGKEKYVVTNRLFQKVRQSLGNQLKTLFFLDEMTIQAKRGLCNDDVVFEYGGFVWDEERLFEIKNSIS